LPTPLNPALWYGFNLPFNPGGRWGLGLTLPEPFNPTPPPANKKPIYAKKSDRRPWMRNHKTLRKSESMPHQEMAEKFCLCVYARRTFLWPLNPCKFYIIMTVLSSGYFIHFCRNRDKKCGFISLQTWKHEVVIKNIRTLISDVHNTDVIMKMYTNNILCTYNEQLFVCILLRLFVLFLRRFFNYWYHPSLMKNCEIIRDYLILLEIIQVILL